MRAYLEVWTDRGAQLVPLEEERTTIGRADGNDLVLDDTEVSRLHALVERLGGGWCVRDVGSSNGTYLNGDRVVSDRLLRAGDELRLGRTRIVFRASGTDDLPPTSRGEAPPKLTRREHELLVALCRPLVRGPAFAQPATVRQLADELCIGEAAVRFHLANLYDKFGLYDTGDDRRAQLASDAVRRRAVTIGDLGT